MRSRRYPSCGVPARSRFEGKVITITEALAYPRSIQDPIPILVGGGGEKRTLKMVANYGHASNLMGDADTIRHKIEVLRRHCVDADRDPAEITITTLEPTLHATSGAELAALIERLRPQNQSAEAFAASANAGTTRDQIDRFRRLADLGVGRAVVAFNGNDGPERVAAFREVIEGVMST